MVFNPINKERLMSTDEKIASVSASFAMEDMILTPQELERGGMWSARLHLGMFQ